MVQMERVADQMFQRDPDRLEKWSDRKLMKVNSGKCHILHVAEITPCIRTGYELTGLKIAGERRTYEC